MGARFVDEETIRRWIAEAIASNPSGSSYLVYNVQLSQVGSGAPSANVFGTDGIGFGAWTRGSTGSFRCISTKAFDDDKTQIQGIGRSNNNSVCYPLTNFGAITGYIILTYDGNGGFLTLYVDVLDASFAAVELSALVDRFNLPEIRFYE
jgi:hypothetical protein